MSEIKFSIQRAEKCFWCCPVIVAKKAPVFQGSGGRYGIVCEPPNAVGWRVVALNGLLGARSIMSFK